jgi:hypothetical protein
VIPAVVVIKDRPLERGHWLYATRPPGRVTKRMTCAVHCSCGDRLVISSVDQYQDALDLGARNHRRMLELGALGEGDMGGGEGDEPERHPPDRVLGARGAEPLEAEDRTDEEQDDGNDVEQQVEQLSLLT